MKYRSIYSFSFVSSLPEEVNIPFQHEFGSIKFRINEIDERRQYATGFVEETIDPKELCLSGERTTLAGTTIGPRLIVPGTPALGDAVLRMVERLSFLTDTPIRHSRILHLDELVPENQEDETYLDSFGTRDIHHETSITMSIRTFTWSDLREDFFDKLGEKDAGLALYAQALLEQEPVGQFRDLWKVLESGFGVQNEELIGCLSKYEPTQQLGFSEPELKSLLVLRGRASHASSRAGIEDIKIVNREVTEKMPRLKCLVEQLLLTKKSWGFKTQATDRLARVASYISADGSLILRPHGEQNRGVGPV